MQINVTVDGLDAIDLTAEIGEEIRDYDDETGEYNTRGKTLADIVAEKITARLTADEYWSGLRKRFLELRDEEIRAAVRPLVENALTGPITKTNVYGEPTSGTTTMRELVMAEVNKVIHERSDKYRSDSPTMLQANITKAVRTELDKELRAVFDAEKQKVVGAVRASAAELVAEAVKKGLGR
jgi:hypothetical protein